MALRAGILGTLETITEIVPVACVVCDATGVVTAANRAARELFGELGGTDVVGAAELAQFLRSDLSPLPADERPLERALCRGESVREEELLLRFSDGSQRTVDAWAMPVLEGGEVVGAIATFNDVTYLRDLEDELGFAQRSLAEVLEGIKDGLVVLDREWRCTYVNDRAAELFRKTREELLGSDIGKVFPGVLGTAFEERARVAMTRRSFTAFEGYYRPYDTWVEVRAHPTAAGLTVFFQDITERRRQEGERRALNDAVATERRRLTAMMQESTVGLAYLDTRFRVVVANELYADYSGFSLGELYGESVFDLMPHAQLQRLFEEARETGRPAEVKALSYANELQPWRGTTYYDWRLQPLTRGRAAEGFILSVVDVTRETIRRRFAEALSRIDLLVHGTVDSEEILERALHEASDALGCESASLALREPGGWRPRYGYRVPQELASRVLSDEEFPLAAKVGRQREVVVDRGPRGQRGAEEAGRAGTGRSTISLPLLRDEEVAGVLSFYYHGREVPFLDEHVEFARRLAASVSLALENARLFRALQHHARFTEALNGMATVVASSLDAAQILSTVVSLAGESSGADACSVGLRRPEGWVPAYAWNMPEGFLGRVFTPEEAHVAERAAVEMRPVVVTDYGGSAETERRVYEAWGVGATLAAPLMVGDEAVGCLSFSYFGDLHEYTEDEVDFAVKTAAMVSAALRNADLFDELRRVAVTLQENLIHPLPEIEGLGIAVVSEPANAPDLVGGDFSDIFVLDDGRVAILVGDVAGKGLRAAGLTETVRTAARAFALIDASPSFVLRRASELLMREQSDYETFVTAFMAVLDPATGEIDYASAGHPPPVLCSDKPVLLEVAFGPPLGTWRAAYHLSHGVLRDGDVLVVYTDGVTESRRDGELFGESRVLEAIGGVCARPPAEVADALLHAVREFSTRLWDDLQIMVLRFDRRNGSA